MTDENPTSTTPKAASADQSPAGSGPRQGDFRVGQVFGRGVSIWFGRMHVYVALTLIVNIPSFLYQWWLVRSSADGEVPSVGFSIWMVITLVVNMTLSNLATATLIYAVFQALRGRPGAIVTCLQYVLARLPMLLAVTLMISLVTALAMGVAVLPGAALAIASENLGIFVMMVCGAIAAVWMMTVLWTAMAVAVVENPGVVASLRRSRDLTKGYRGRILLLVMLVGIVTFLIGWVAGAVATAMPETASTLFTSGVTVILGSISAVISGVGYHDLRVAAEGLDTRELAAIFD